MLLFVFFFNDTATTDIYTLSLHDALPILLVPFRHVASSSLVALPELQHPAAIVHVDGRGIVPPLFPLLDRKSTRLNSSHANISYAVFCLKKKKNTINKSSPCTTTTTHEIH